jgi:hypothetical protein
LNEGKMKNENERKRGETCGIHTHGVVDSLGTVK